MFIFWIILVVGAAYFFRQRDQWNPSWSEQTRYQAGSSSDASELLRERYARGEICEQEFNERKRVLQQY